MRIGDMVFFFFFCEECDYILYVLHNFLRIENNLLNVICKSACAYSTYIYGSIVSCMTHASPIRVEFSLYTYKGFVRRSIELQFNNRDK